MLDVFWFWVAEGRKVIGGREMLGGCFAFWFQDVARGSMVGILSRGGFGGLEDPSGPRVGSLEGRLELSGGDEGLVGVPRVVGRSGV